MLTDADLKVIRGKEVMAKCEMSVILSMKKEKDRHNKREGVRGTMKRGFRKEYKERIAQEKTIRNKIQGMLVELDYTASHFIFKIHEFPK